MNAQVKMGVTVMATILATGLILDEASRGTFGEMVQTFARKVTRGYGV